MKHLITGVAAIALAATAALGQGNSQGKGNDANRGKPAQAQAAGKDRGNSDRGNQRQAERGNNNVRQAQTTARRGNEGNRGQGNAQRNDNARADNAQANRGNANAPGRAAADRGRDNAQRQVVRGNDDSRAVRVDNDNRGIRVLDDGRRIFETRGARGDFLFADARRGLINGCPPGLAKRNNGCRPPGLARQDARYRFDRFGPDWWGLGRLGDGRYFYVDYYDLGPRGGYRYADNVLYRVDPETAAITSIAALLTGNDIQIGAPMPLGYDVYNVPYPYRSRYYDGPNALYRYNDGYIYQVDPTTRLVTAAIELIAS